MWLTRYSFPLLFVWKSPGFITRVFRHAHHLYMVANLIDKRFEGGHNIAAMFAQHFFGLLPWYQNLGALEEVMFWCICNRKKIKSNLQSNRCLPSWRGFSAVHVPWPVSRLFHDYVCRQICWWPAHKTKRWILLWMTSKTYIITAIILVSICYYFCDSGEYQLRTFVMSADDSSFSSA